MVEQEQQERSLPTTEFTNEREQVRRTRGYNKSRKENDVKKKVTLIPRKECCTSTHKLDAQERKKE